jgi:hypothetical protein
MNWFGNTAKKVSGKKRVSKPRPKRGSTRKVSRSKRGSGKRRSSVTKTKTRYYVKNDNRIVTAYKKESGPGYIYRKRSASGIRNVPIKGTTYKTEHLAKKKVSDNKR